MLTNADATIKLVIALDAMGGDKAPQIVIQGASLALEAAHQKNIAPWFKIFGDQAMVQGCLQAYPKLKANSELIATEEVVLATDSPLLALRKRRQSSLYLAIGAVASKEADCLVSAGNTGALVAISKSLLGTLPNIYRPAIVTTVPTEKKDIVVLDLGANVECNSETLYQFALMGVAFAKSIFHKKNPSVAILNIGSEEIKGTDTVKGAYNLLKNSEGKLNFSGYVEPDKMLKGEVDVVVTDGFCGNMLLKTAEGAFFLIKNTIKNSFTQSFIARLLAPIYNWHLKKHLKRLNPKLRSGALLIGLNGIIVKSHGSSDALAFSKAIEFAINVVVNKLNLQINNEMDALED